MDPGPQEGDHGGADLHHQVDHEILQRQVHRALLFNEQGNLTVHTSDIGTHIHINLPKQIIIVKQINGDYKVKNDRMKKLYNKTLSLLSSFQKWQLLHILRDKNTVADKLATNGRLKNNI